MRCHKCGCKKRFFKRYNPLEDFIEEVQEDFINNELEYLRMIQDLLPEVKIKAVELTGSYAFNSTKKPTEESDVDLKVIYSGSLSEQEVADCLYGNIHGFGGCFDIVPHKIS